jgi:uncharacterized protein (DUF488 family)
MSETIYTIGHSNLSFLKFLSHIQAHHITHIVDIRSVPYSRYAPWSNKSRLHKLFMPLHIRYTYLGNRLGGKNITNSEDYQSIATQEPYLEAIHVLLQLSLRGHIALLCAEGDPAKCHRQYIIAQTLIQFGAKVVHILKDGSLQDAWKESPDINQPSLF